MSKLQHIIHSPVAKLLLMVAFLSTFIAGNVNPAAAASKPAACTDVEVIFVHGAATDYTDSPDVKSWREAFEAQDFAKVSLSFYSLGESAAYGTRYQGADIGLGSLTSIKNTVETFFSAGKSGEFKDSINAGLTELKGHIAETQTTCPSTKFVFGGYSEGAYLLHMFFKEHATSLGLDSNNVIYIATFGDPKLYLKEGEGINPPACSNEAFSDYRVYAPNCRAHSGILGAEKPDYFPTSYLDRAGLWCTKKDVMCSNYFDLFNLSHLLDDHLNYASHEPYPYKQAAILVRQKLAQIFPDKVDPGSETVHSAARDTAILIDTTGSMTGIINKYKTEAKKIAENTVKNGGRIALYEYRDLKADGKELVPRELCDFSCTYDEFVEKIDNLEVDGGGDTPESALSASLGVMNKLKWQKGATKSIVLLTDATYHDADFDGTTLSDVVRRSLEIDPVNFYVVAPSSITSSYNELAAKTNGRVFDLSDKDITLSSETLLNRPDLNFQLESYEATTGEIVTFLVDTTINNLDHFEWDLDLDGIFELTTTSPAVSYLYTTPTAGFVQAKVVAKSGLSSTASAVITVKSGGELGEPPVISDLTVESTKVSYQKSENTAAVIIFLDDYALGLTSETEFTITDLGPGEHTIALVPVSTTGLRGESLSKIIGTIPKAPNTSLPAR